jgi:UDP-N-acetylmuramate dehydrogenase
MSALAKTAEPLPESAPDSLIHRLPKIRGRYSENALLSKVTWFQVGGPAEVMFKPADLADLQHFLRERPRDIPLTIIGVGSNILVRDSGVRGVVIRLGREFASIQPQGNFIHAGAAALDVNVALVAQQAGLGGMEFLCGIPGTIGGALRMNAGAYGREIRDCLVSATALDSFGNLHDMPKDVLGLSYRHSDVPPDWMFVGAKLFGLADDPHAIAARMKEIATKREATQPVRAKTGGSTFANPDGHKAWELIDRAGCRGLKIGGAQISPKHTNFMINADNASAADLENLGEEVRQRVLAQSGIELRWEIERIGER